MTDHGTSHLPLGQQPGPSTSQVSQAYLQVLSMDQPTTPWTRQRNTSQLRETKLFSKNYNERLYLHITFLLELYYSLLFFTILVNGCDHRPSQSFDASLPDLLG